jgi:hypothetical protein
MTAKIILILSLIINSVLLIFVTGPLPLLLFLSVVLNLGLIWLSIKLFTRLEECNDDIESMLNTVGGLNKHIRSIYEMEMFYGEPILESMLEHIDEVSQEIEDYRFKYSNEPIEDTEEDEDEELEELTQDDEREDTQP